MFPNADVKEVLKFYETITGKRVIYDIQALGQVNIEVKDKIPVEEAQRLIEISLIMNGFTLVPVDDKYVKLLGTGRNPRGFGIPLISDELLIPNDEQVISYLFKLRYADPTEIATMLTAYISPSSLGYSQTLALPKANAILVTENSIIIRKFLQIVREVDTPPAEVVSEFIRAAAGRREGRAGEAGEDFRAEGNAHRRGASRAAGAARHARGHPDSRGRHRDPQRPEFGGDQRRHALRGLDRHR